MGDKKLDDDFVLKVGNSRRGPKGKDSVKNWMLQKTLQSIARSSSMKGGGHYFYPGQNFQNSIVKVSYSVSTNSGQWRAHGRYLEREGAQTEGERGKGFNDVEGDEVAIAETLSDWQKSEDELVWKIVVSPEQADRLDLKEHTRHLVQKMEKDFGFKFEWVAIDHYNTDNPHVHIVIRGRNSQKHTLLINKGYIKQGMRYRSREEATRTLGIRLESDLLRRRQKVIHQKRVTELDREIIRIKNSKNLITFKGTLPKDDFETEKRLQIIGRLQFLESTGFAKKKGAITWEVSSELMDGLRVYQMSQDIIKRKSQHLSRITDLDLPLVYTKLVKGDHVAGRVIGFGLHNELRDKRYMLIEGLDGKVHYMHPHQKLLRSRDAKDIHNGDIIHVEVKSFIKHDEDITYLNFQNWGELKKIEKSRSMTLADKYFLELKDVPKDLKNSLTFRESFFKVMESRSKIMKQKYLSRVVTQRVNRS